MREPALSAAAACSASARPLSRAGTLLSLALDAPRTLTPQAGLERLSAVARCEVGGAGEATSSAGDECTRCSWPSAATC